MTAEGWREAAENAAQSAGRPDRWTMIAPDQVLTDGQMVKAGGVPLQSFETPGHTMGTASFSFDAFDGTKRYRAFTVGGLGLNAIRGPEQVEAYISSLKRIRALTEDRVDPVTTHLTTHAFSNGLTETKELLKARKPGDANPLVDPKGFLNSAPQQQGSGRAGSRSDCGSRCPAQRCPTRLTFSQPRVASPLTKDSFDDP
ncbi:hypothetical protein [Variovorax sp. AFSI2.2]|uniref:hypothetical protein n=1 Tax=Variovorax sp. AFSI2.2 TaxID=3384160 RepID=UPI003EBE6FBC